MQTARIVPKSENWDAELAAAPGTVYTPVSILVPPGVVMRLKKFANYLGLVVNWGHVRWDFLKNGAPMYPYFDIRTQMGYSAAPREIENLPVEGGCLFEIRITQIDGVLDPTAGVALDWDMEYKN